MTHYLKCNFPWAVVFCFIKRFIGGVLKRTSSSNATSQNLIKWSKDVLLFICSYVIWWLFPAIYSRLVSPVPRDKVTAFIQFKLRLIHLKYFAFHAFASTDWHYSWKTTYSICVYWPRSVYRLISLTIRYHQFEYIQQVFDFNISFLDVCT